MRAALRQPHGVLLCSRRMLPLPTAAAPLAAGLLRAFSGATAAAAPGAGAPSPPSAQSSSSSSNTSSSSSPDSPPLPLAGLRVVDLTRILAGPWCTQMLGDLGADVIKVEESKKGDDTRSWGPPFVEGVASSPGSPPPRLSTYFLCCNRNKRSIAVDLKTPAGRDIIYGLVAQSDVFVENFLPGKMAELGFSYEKLSSINPRLVYASISGFGATGPASKRAGYDVALAAYGGLMSITGPEDPASPPVKVGVAVTDMATGAALHSAILAALYARDRPGGSGRGQRIDTSLLEVQIAGLANIASNVLVTGSTPRRHGSAHESIVPYQAFAAADGHIIVAAMNDGQFAALARVVGHPEWASDPRFATNPARVAHRGVLLPPLVEVLATKTRAEWLQALTAANVTTAPINTVKEALADEQVLAREMVVDVPLPSLGTVVKMTGIPVKYSCTQPKIRLPPPLLGQHTDDVLGEVLGMSAEQVAALRAAKVVA